MSDSHDSLRAQALDIWHAGVAAVRSETLIAQTVQATGDGLKIGAETLAWPDFDRLLVVGAGKAGAGMAAAVETALGPQWLAAKQVSGWVNVPADCVRTLQTIHLHAARPAGVNEPTAEGVAGAQEILKRVSELGPRDVCLVLLSGGGSALLPAPAAGITLADKQAVTRALSSAGASIHDLNTVRKHLSAIKGGGLARVCTAGRMIVLVISDVLGDPLDVIASGPTIPDPSTAAEALAILTRFVPRGTLVPDAVYDYLQQREPHATPAPQAKVEHLLIGTNAVAVAAATKRAQELGFMVASEPALQPEGQAEAIGRSLAKRLRTGLCAPPQAIISGGEPVVTLPPVERRGRGGRNQQLVLAALDELFDVTDREFALLSGGTDGEDGPTDAAGAVIDNVTLSMIQFHRAELHTHLANADAYPWLQSLDALIQTGPTHTNVMDLRVALWK